MKIPFDLDGKEIKITLTELCARLWPFGQWDVAFINKNGFARNRAIPSRKEEAVAICFRYLKSVIIEDAWVEKIGGFFDGIRYVPRRGGRKTKYL